MSRQTTPRRREREGMAGVAGGVLLAAVGYFAGLSPLVAVGVIAVVFGALVWASSAGGQDDAEAS